MPLFDFYGSDIQSEEEKHALQPLSPDVPQAQTVVQEGGLQDAFDDTPIPRVKLQHKYNKPEQQGTINPYGESGLTGRQLSNLRRSFSENPLLCIEDNEMRQKIESIAATFGVEDGERIKKAVALAHYYSMGHREKTGYIFDNLDAAIQEFEGKPMSVDQAYESVKQLYEPQQEGIWGNRWVAAATAGGAEVDKTAANAVSFLGRRLTESGQIVAITGAGLYSGLLRLIGADGKAARVWESAKDSLLSRDYGKEWEDAVQQELAKPIETVETWAQQNMKVPENWVTDSESVSDWVENAGLSLLNYAPQLGAQLTLMTATGGASSLGLVYGINGYYDIKGDLPEISEEKALLYGLGIGLINGALENVSLGIVEGKVAEHFASNGIKKGMTRILEYLGAGALMEGAEESLEEFTENVLDIAMGRRGDKTDWTSKDWTDNLFRGMPEAFFLGFTTGFGMAGLNVKPLREKAELNQKVLNYAEKRKSDLDTKETMTKDEELEYNVLSAALDSNDPNRVLHAAKVVSLNAKLRQQQEQNAAQKRYNEAEERFSKAQEELDAISARPTQDAKNRNTAVTKYRAAKAELDAAKADLDAARKDFVKAFPEEETIEERAIREAEEVRIARDLKRRIPWHLQDTVDKVNDLAKLYTAIPIHAVNTFDELPEAARREAEARGLDKSKADAVWSNDEVYVIADKTRPSDVEKRILHEVVGHVGLRLVFGKDFDAFLDDVFARHSKEIEEMGLSALYNTMPDTVEGRRYLADEFLAKMAEQDVKPSWWKELLAQIRAYLRKVAPQLHFSDAEIEAALVRSARAVRSEQRLSDVAPESRFALIGSSGAISNLGRDNPNREINLDNAEKATRMRDYGYSDKEIWLATGWTRGADGQWRMEIPDLNVKTDELTQGDNYNALIDYNGPLDGYVDAPEIFEAYPQLKQYNVMFIPLPRGEGGYFDRANNTIAINRTLFVDQNFDVLNDMAADMKEAKTQHEADIIHANIKEELDTFAEGIRNTLIHEVQHAIQQIEGFARGGNLEDAKNLPDDLDPMFVRANTQLSELEQRYNDAFDKLIQAEAYLDWSDEMSLALSRYVGSNPKSSDLEIIRNGAAGNPHLDSFIEALEHFKRVDFEKNVANLDVVSSKGSFGRYRRFAGEVEARNAEQRAAMSDARRRETMPSETEDVPRENQIVRYSVSPVWTGSAADYEQPDLHYVGTGEGQQVYGWGLYGSESRSVAEWYSNSDYQRKTFPADEDGNISSDFSLKFVKRNGKPIQTEEYSDDPDNHMYGVLAYSITLSLYDFRRDKSPANHSASELKNKTLEYTEWQLNNFKKSENDPSARYYIKNDIDAAEKAIELIQSGELEFSDFDISNLKRNLYNQTFWPDKEENLLDWDNRLTPEQVEQIQRQLDKEHVFDEIPKDEEELTGFARRGQRENNLVYLQNYLPLVNGESVLEGKTLYYALEKALGSPQEASEFLYRAGIDGVTYIGDSSGVRNYVAFSDKDIRVDEHIRFSVSPVWTGSAADYEQPDLHYVGTGEGAQAYGWGLYGSSVRSIGEGYARRDVREKIVKGIIPGVFVFDGEEVSPDTDIETLNLSEEEKPVMQDMLAFTGKNYVFFPKYGLLDDLYNKYLHDAAKAFFQKNGKYPKNNTELWKDQVEFKKKYDIASDLISRFEHYAADDEGRRNLYRQTFWLGKEENLLDWDKKVPADQILAIKHQAEKEGIELNDASPYLSGVSTIGVNLYKQITNDLGSPKAASEFLYRAGIDGIIYIGDSSGVRNYVAFSDQDIRVDEHIRFSLENYSEEDKQQLVTLLKPKWIEEAFVEPSEVKAFLESIGETGIDENDAWALYHMAGSEIRAEKKKADDKKRDNWIYENDLLYHDAVDYGGLDFKIIPSLRFLDNNEWPGTFIADSWRKRGKKRKQGKNESSLRYHEYIRKREAELTSEHQTGITSDDLAKYIARIRGGDELDIEEQIIEHFRYLNRRKLWSQYHDYKKEQNYRNKIEQNEAEEEFAQYKAEQIQQKVEELLANKGQITEEWAIANPDVFAELYRLLMKEEPPKSRKPSKENLEAINAALANEDVNAATYKAVRRALTSQFQQRLTALREEMNDKNANAVKLQREAAAFAEENLPPELRGMFTRGIIKLLDYGTSPSKNFPEGRRMHEFYQLQDEILKASQTKRRDDSIGHIREMLDAVKMRRNWKGIPVSVIPSEQARVERIRKIIDMSAASVANAIEYNNSRILELEAGGDASFENGEAVDISAEKDKLVEDNALLELFGNLEYRKPDSALKAEDFLQDLIKGGKAKFKSLLAQQAGRVMVMRQQAVSEITGGKNTVKTGGAVGSVDAKNHTPYILKNMNLGSLMRLIVAKSGIDFDSSVIGKLFASDEDSTQKEQTLNRRMSDDFEAELDEILNTRGKKTPAKKLIKGRFLKGLFRVEQKTDVFKTQFSRQKVIDPLDAPIVEVGRSSSKIHLIPVEDYTRRVKQEDGSYKEETVPGVRSILRAIDNGGAFEIGDGANLDEMGVWMLRKQLEDYDAGIDRRFDFFKDEIDAESAKKLKEDSEKDMLAVIFRGKNVESKQVEVPLSQGTALQILLTWEQEDYRANMKWNGWSEESIEQVKKFLKPETLRLGYWMRDYFAKQRGELDAAVVKRYGAHLPENQNYWPGRFSGTQAKVGTGGPRKDTVSVNPNFLIARKFHLNPLDMDVDAFSVFYGGQFAQNHFLAWGDTIRDLREVLGDVTVQNAISENFGKDVLDNLIERIAAQAHGVDEEYIAKMLNGMYRWWVPSKIGLNISSVIKQKLSELAYMNYMPVKEYVKYRTRANNLDSDYRAFVQMALNSNYLKNRMFGGIDRDLLYLSYGMKYPNRYSPLTESLMDFATLGTKWADKSAVLHGGFAIYQYTLDQARESGLSERDAQERARRAWMRATDETQQSGYLKDQNYFQMNKGFIRYFTAFMSNPIQVMNLELQTLNEIRYNPDNAAAKQKMARQILVNHLIVPTLMQFTTDMVRAGFNPGDWWDDAEFEDYFFAWLFGPFEGLFFAKDVIAGLNYGANVILHRKGKMQQTASAVQLAVDATNDIGRAIRDIQDGELSAEDIADGLRAASDIGMLYGATDAPGATEAGSIGAFVNATTTQVKRIGKAFSDDEDGKKTTSKRRRGGGSKRR